MEPELRDLLNQTVSVSAATARDLYGTETWAVGVSYPARVSPFVPLEQAADNDSAPPSGMVHMDGNVPVTTESRLTLPDGSTPTIMRVDKFTDVDGSVYATKVVYG